MVCTQVGTALQVKLISKQCTTQNSNSVSIVQDAVVFIPQQL